MEFCSISRFAFHPKVTAHHLHKTNRDGESKARAAELSGRGSVGLGKGIENRFLLLEWNSYPRVRDREMKQLFSTFSVSHVHVERNLALFGELDGIAH